MKPFSSPKEPTWHFSSNYKGFPSCLLRSNTVVRFSDKVSEQQNLEKEILVLNYTLLKKQSKFPLNNMKCRGKHDTTVYMIDIPRSITFYRLHFMLYRGKSISFGTVYICTVQANYAVGENFFKL